MGQSNCELKKEKNNIKIYSCPTKESSFNTIRAEFEVNSTIEKYISIVIDIENYKIWRYRETEHRLLKKISDTELIYYNQVDAPFPVSDRDMVSHLTISQNTQNKILTITAESMPDYIPHVDNIVRIPRSKSIMTLKQISESKLKAICTIEVDPGGSIPAWVSNTFGTQAPYETFRNLIKEIDIR
ncbi:MAG: START domain-containing protein [Cytophagales bacterium]|nr:START domain-containing protein [Cytophagales bacterium]